jgi:hypothetical protein
LGVRSCQGRSGHRRSSATSWVRSCKKAGTNGKRCARGHGEVRVAVAVGEGRQSQTRPHAADGKTDMLGSGVAAAYTILTAHLPVASSLLICPTWSSSATQEPTSMGRRRPVAKSKAPSPLTLSSLFDAEKLVAALQVGFGTCFYSIVHFGLRLGTLGRFKENFWGGRPEDAQPPLRRAPCSQIDRWTATPSLWRMGRTGSLKPGSWYAPSLSLRDHESLAALVSTRHTSRLCIVPLLSCACGRFA